MKNIKYLVIAFLLAPLFFVNTGCGDDPVVVTPVDTTPTQAEDTVFAGFKAGFDKYELVLNNNQSDAHYEAGTDETYVDAVGYSKKGPGGVVEGAGVIELVFPGKVAKAFDQTKGDAITMEIVTGSPPTQNGYSYDDESGMKITVTEYGAVGEKIKGTFSGKLKTNGIGSVNFTDGFFEVTRSADQ